MNQKLPADTSSARPPGGICGACKTPKDCARDNFCFWRDNAERAMRCRIDLCTCGKPRGYLVHEDRRNVHYHTFMPNPQPPAPPVDPALTRVTATRLGGTWAASVTGINTIGYGQAVAWLDAVNAAIEDLKEKS